MLHHPKELSNEQWQQKLKIAPERHNFVATRFGATLDTSLSEE